MFGKPARSVGEMRDRNHKGPRAASFMGGDLVFEGNLRGDGELHVDGLVRGDVVIGRLTLGERGSVEGSVSAETAEIHGRIIGSVTARRVVLHPGAQVEGDITHEELTIEAGALFQGRSVRRAAASPEPAELQPAPGAPLPTVPAN